MKQKDFFSHLLVFALSCFFLFGTVVYGKDPNCYRITFTDKKDSQYSIDRPEEFLSPRAIAKRTRFSIPISEQDLPVNQQYISAIQSFIEIPSSIIATSKWNNSVVLFFQGSDNYKDIVDEMVAHFSFIEDALPVAIYDQGKNYEMPIYEEIPDAKGYLSSSCNYDYGISIENIKIHNGHLLHQAGFCGEDMLICVFDVGWDNFDKLSYFKPLYDNGQIWGTRDLIPGINDVYTGHGHGTSVTSEMASEIEGYMVGAAPKANYFFVRSDDPWREQPVEEDFYAQAAEIADSLGADVTTASLGYTLFDYEWQNTFTPDDNDGTKSIASRAASILAQKGVIVVNSAGNEGYGDWHFLGRPADAFNILTVGAVNKDGFVAGFSSYGPSADGRVKPDVASVGWDAWLISSYGSLATGNGTSMAAPIIAGLSACLWQALPEKNSLEIMQLIRESGDRYNDPDDRTGYGIPNFYKIINRVSDNKVSPFGVYPNPTTGELTIDNGELTMSDIEIFDIYGRIVSSHNLINTSSHHLINISQLVPGIYFLKIKTDSTSEIIKIIKQ
jgi:subtilisin family serine protease